jgi:hypothetical protein
LTSAGGITQLVKLRLPCDELVYLPEWQKVDRKAYQATKTASSIQDMTQATSRTDFDKTIIK